jgi:hypothetical protein
MDITDLMLLQKQISNVLAKVKFHNGRRLQTNAEDSSKTLAITYTSYEMSTQRETPCVLALLFRDVNPQDSGHCNTTVRFIRICLTNVHCTTVRISQAGRFSVDNR